MGINKIAESNDYKENVKDVVDADATHRLEELKKHFAESSKEEQIRMANVFNEKVKNYGIESVITDNIEITEDDEENMKEVAQLKDAIKNYPNISEAKKEGIEALFLYQPRKRVEPQIDNAIYQNKPDKSDDNIETYKRAA